MCLHNAAWENVPDIFYLRPRPYTIRKCYPSARHYRQIQKYTTSREEDGLDPESVEYALLKQQGIDSLLATPLKIGGKYVGFLGVDNPMENMDLFVLLQSVAAFVINDIQSRRDMVLLSRIS